ncbi:MAG TPA: hypothetical protein VIF81_01805 [Pyrinomonadaceae bacterium]|jgi:UDP-3-O-[3-hydroxymyristoyl] glucosamine N-acyltransferase
MMLRAALHEQEIRRIIGAPGDGEHTFDGVSTLGAADDRSLYFINQDFTPETLSILEQREGCIVVALRGASAEVSLQNCLVLEADNPRTELTKVLQFIRDEQRVAPLVTERKISATANISPLAVVEGAVEIGERVLIEPFCMIGPDVKIGSGSIISSGVRVYPRVVIGEKVVVGANSVIGHQGFGFVRDEAGNKIRMPHLGGVAIGSHVEIGALASVQSGTIIPTAIADHAKIDEYVHVGHNVRIARGASVTAGVIIAGHAVIDEEAWVGINSSIREGRHVGAYSLVGMDSSIQQDLEARRIARSPRPAIEMRADSDDAAIGFAQRKMRKT